MFMAKFNIVALLAIAALSVVEASVSASNAPSVPLKWFVFREDCFDTFFEKKDFFNKECLKITISKCIGYTIIAGAFIIKVPQILKILKSKSVEGISKYLYYIDLLMYMNSTGYSLHMKIPFSVSGENIIILIQLAIIVLQFWTYSKTITALEKFILSAFFFVYSFILLNDTLLSEEAWTFIAQINILLLCSSRLPQIFTNFQNKSTGNLAFITFFLGFGGSLARLGTVIVETDDFVFLLGFVVAVCLNGIIVLQFILYWNNSKHPKVDNTKKEKKNQ
ncbi:UNKNOWN [Stylonychia lemnae]|uniref:Mannose-P-dolichol utilization defect 1 protein homolog n=1 Tax=Stylonychia lemnae TaxID=5949 RepID=A0A078AT62_STYLE|nr:UNKNOWN [Stylonychia lemnae]|eukprot:CDW85211.1 UNKNOWN [Stylonychia lemnae]